MRRLFLIYCILSVLLLLTAVSLVAQEERATLVGDFSINISDNLSTFTLNFPRSSNSIQTTAPSTNKTFGFLIGIKEDWTNDAGEDLNHKIASVWGDSWNDVSQETPPYYDEFARIWKYTPPTKIVDGTDYTNLFFPNDPVDTSIPSDVKIYNHSATWTGVDIERTVYAYANSKHDDYHIADIVLTNTSNETKEDMYFALRFQTSSQDIGDHWANYYGADYTDYVTGDMNADSMRIFYMWSADELSASPNKDDRANPDEIWGHFQQPQYWGLAVLHADKSPTDESDDPSQPFKAGWNSLKQGTAANRRNDSHEDIYTDLSQPWGSYAAISNLYTADDARYKRVLPPDFDFANTDPGTEAGKSGLMSFGPYQLEPGQDLHFVFAYAAGSISNRLAIDAGLAYDPGYDGLRERIPMPYDVKDIAQAGDLLTKEQKNKILDLGKDSLFIAASKAFKNLRGEYGSEPLDIPMAPATPSLEVTSMPGQIHLKWGTEATQYSGSGELAGYRIYRSYYRSESITFPTDTSFVLLKEVDTNTNEYNDESAVRGRQYWYYVTAYNNEGLESSPFLNRTGGERQAAASERTPDANWQDNVVVVPNPWHSRAMRKYDGKRLTFFNLPPYCDIHIYTMTGDLVQTLNHTSGTGDEAWQRQLTFSNQQIVSGVYFYVVEELDSPNGSPTNKMAKGKFIIVN